MKMLFFAMYDKKLEAFMQPLLMRTKGEAQRSLLDAVGKGDAKFASFPEDYVLMELGSFDDSDGSLAPNANGPVPVMTALEAVQIMSKDKS